MKKPDDYNKYFNEDGTGKKCPYDFFSDQASVWNRRQIEIAHIVKGKEEMEEFEAYIYKEHTKAKIEAHDKMNS